MLVCCCTVTETVEGDPRKSLKKLLPLSLMILVLRNSCLNLYHYREEMLEMLKRMEDVDGCPRYGNGLFISLYVEGSSFGQTSERKQY